VSEEVVRRVVGSLGFPRERVDRAVACLLDQPRDPKNARPVDQVLSFKETCQMLSLSKSGLRRIMAAGELQPIWLSQRRMGFRMKEVSAFITSRNHWGSDS